MEGCTELTDWCESSSGKPISLSRKSKPKELSKQAPRILQVIKAQNKQHYLTHAVCKHKDSYFSIAGVENLKHDNPLSGSLLFVSASVVKEDFSSGELSLRF